MIARFHYDDQSLIELLRDQPDEEVSDLLAHVETCETCQAKLDTLSSGGLSWGEVNELMRQDELSPAVDFARSPATHDQDGILAISNTFLRSSEHSNSLGRFARYEIMEILGRGGMGIVMRGYDTTLERYCAVKVLAPELASSSAARKRFSREAKSAAAVVHPHVVPIQTVDEHDGLPYLVMPVIEGKSLQQRVESDGPLSIIESIRIASQIADGLAAAHAQGLVHRDIKPANILLENGVERVQITDFGLARAVDDASMTRSGVIAGTPQYMSPEQQAHGDEIDHRSDLFSLGSVMYFMLTGRSPFRAETTMGVLNRIGNDEPRRLQAINPDIPLWLENVVMKLLSKLPADRFDTAQSTAELLEECLAHVQQPATMPLPECITAELAPQKIHRPPIGKFIAAGAFAFSLIFAGVLIVLELNKGTLTIHSEVDDVSIRIMKGDETVEQLTVNQSGKAVRIAAGNYRVMIDGQTDGIIVKNGQISLRRGKEEIARIVRSTEPTDAHVIATIRSIPFVLGESHFADGDQVDIQSVTTTGSGFEVGATVTVKGLYKLESVDAAYLCFFSTTTLRPGEKPVGIYVQPSQRLKAIRGTHEFTLSKVIREHGSPHISFYDGTTGNGIGGVYFSSMGNVEKRLDRVSLPESKFRIDSGTTTYNLLHGTWEIEWLCPGKEKRSGFAAFSGNAGMFAISGDETDPLRFTYVIQPHDEQLWIDISAVNGAENGGSSMWKGVVEASRTSIALCFARADQIERAGRPTDIEHADPNIFITIAFIKRTSGDSENNPEPSSTSSDLDALPFSLYLSEFTPPPRYEKQPFTVYRGETAPPYIYEKQQFNDEAGMREDETESSRALDVTDRREAVPDSVKYPATSTLHFDTPDALMKYSADCQSRDDVAGMMRCLSDEPVKQFATSYLMTLVTRLQEFEIDPSASRTPNFFEEIEELRQILREEIGDGPATTAATLAAASKDAMENTGGDYAAAISASMNSPVVLSLAIATVDQLDDPRRFVVRFVAWPGKDAERNLTSKDRGFDYTIQQDGDTATATDKSTGDSIGLIKTKTGWLIEDMFGREHATVKANTEPQ